MVDAANTPPGHNGWLRTSVEYEGRGRAEFSDPAGWVEGPTQIRIDEAGETDIEMEVDSYGLDEEIDPTHEFMALLSGQQSHHHEGTTFLPLNLRTDNTCTKFEVGTSYGTFRAGGTSTLSLTKSGHVYEQPKNWKGRSIELTQAASETLTVHLKRQLEAIEGLGDDYQDQGLIFPGERGQPMRPWTLTRTFQKILKHAGLPHLRFHDLRHTCATLMLCEGVHIKIVQELLGHADVTITLNTYSHVLPSMGSEATGAMDRSFG